MPLFNKKVDLKASPLRVRLFSSKCPQITEGLNDYRVISLKLKHNQIDFNDGQWMLKNKTHDDDDVFRLLRRIKMLEEKRNMSELKVEVLLDLLTENIDELTKEHI